jgi:RHS repeat-associated protein
MFRSVLLGTCFRDPEFGTTCNARDDSLHQYGYDALGNRTSTRGVRPGGAGGTWQDTILMWSVTGTYTTGNRIQDFAGCSYAHDDAGNRIRQVCGADTTRYYWNGDGQLTSFKRSGGDSVAFAYDPLGRVVRRTVNGAVASNFLWEGDNLQAELNAAGTTRLGEYSYSGTDRLHAFKPWTQYFYPMAYGHQDGVGNVRGLSSGDGTTWRTYLYDEFGALTGGSSSFSGEAYDRARWKGALSLGSEANLYYMRNRWYDTRTGRFLSEDPIGLAGGLNLYAFAAGDPINGADPTGEDFVRVCVTSYPPSGGVTVTCGWASRESPWIGGRNDNCPGGFHMGYSGQCVPSGAAASDGGVGPGDDPPQLGPQGPSCNDAIGDAIVNVALDLTSAGLGKGARSLLRGARDSNTGLRWTREVAREWLSGAIGSVSRDAQMNAATRQIVRARVRQAAGVYQVAAGVYNWASTLGSRDPLWVKGAKLLPFGIGSAFSVGYAVGVCLF